MEQHNPAEKWNDCEYIGKSIGQNILH